MFDVFLTTNDVKENDKAFPLEERSARQNLADPLPTFKETAVSAVGTLNATGVGRA